MAIEFIKKLFDVTKFIVHIINPHKPHQIITTSTKNLWGNLEI